MLSISKRVVEQFIHYAKERQPEEACGILLGNKDNIHIEWFIPILNVSSNPIQEFKFDPKTIIPALYQLENEKKEWLGVIHSHPTSKAYPSSVDIKNWFYPQKSYWIYSIQEEQLKSYSIVQGIIKEETFSMTTIE